MKYFANLLKLSVICFINLSTKPTAGERGDQLKCARCHSSPPSAAFRRKRCDLFASRGYFSNNRAANWTGHRAAKAEGMSKTHALKLIRRDSKHWSQDEALALFIVVDSFLRARQKKVFGKSAVSIIDLLQKPNEGNELRN